jgi:hypothetical protein
MGMSAYCNIAVIPELRIIPHDHDRGTSLECAVTMVVEYLPAVYSSIIELGRELNLGSRSWSLPSSRCGPDENPVLYWRKHVHVVAR